MKKTLLTLSTLFIGCIFAFSQTVILTSDFETWSGGLPAGWGGSKTNIGSTNIIDYTTNVHGGSHACELVNATTTHKRFTTTNLTVAPATQYEIKFWARGEGEIRTGLFDGRAGSTAGYAPYNAYIVVTTTWTEYTQTINAETSADTAQFIISLRSTVAGNDNIQIDDVTITELGAVTPSNVTIQQIQYTTASPANSPYVNQPVITKGVVTAKYTGGFYIQDGAGSWNGVLVISTTTVQQGDSVQVTGTVAESFNNTQITASAVSILNSGNTLPAPAIVTALEVNAEDNEGCLVTIQNGKCTNVNSGYGMWKIEDATDSTKVFDQIYAFTPTLNVFYNVTGPVYYAYSEARICPRSVADVTISSNVEVSNIDENVSIYPNPVATEINFNNVSLGTMYDVVNVNGQIVISGGQYLGQPVNVESFEAGNYYLKLYTKNGVMVHSFVKE